MNSVKEINIENRMYYFFDDTISIKYLETKKIKINKNSYKNVFTYCISYETTISAKSLCFIISKMNGYIEESTENKYLTLVPTDKSKDTL